MTASATDYTSLVTSEHQSAPKFMAMVAAVAQCFVDQINVVQSIPAAFDLDQAVGVQLDAVGLWAGITRQVKTPLNVYFSLDTANLGFDQGSWQGPFDPSAGLVSLDDDTFRTLIRAKIAANHWDGTLAGSAAVLAILFPPNISYPAVTMSDGTPVVAYDPTSGTTVPVYSMLDQTPYVFVQDGQDMTITFGISGFIPSAVLRALFAGGYLPLKPEGVLANYVIPSATNTAIFGFDVENQYLSGLDSGSWAVAA